MPMQLKMWVSIMHIKDKCIITGITHDNLAHVCTIEENCLETFGDFIETSCQLTG